MFGKQHQKHILYIIRIILLISLMLIAIALSWFLLPHYHYNRQRQADLDRLIHEEYNGVFCSVYPVEYILEEDFVTYRGLDVIKSNTTLQRLEHLGEYLQTALSSGNSIDTIYLGLDPEQIWNYCGKNGEQWTNLLNSHILNIVSAHPDIKFEILLPAPILSYWTGKSEENTEQALITYQSLIDMLEPYTNITTFFLGSEYWLIGNPSNYMEPMIPNRMIAHKMFLFTFCDGVYRINSASAQTKLASLREIIQHERLYPTDYPDFSHLNIVFFGDSIIGNYTGSSSVPGVVSGLTNAHTYNCGIGGVAASKSTGAELNFPMMVNSFITGDLTAIPMDTPFAETTLSFNKYADSNNKLCFVINYGLNDYFLGFPLSDSKNPEDITTYAGALRKGISTLQEKYPEALIILMSPTYTTAFSCGTEINSEKGSVLTDYVDTAQMIAEETNILFMNNYLNLGIDQNNATMYLSDTIHLNETGRFLLGQHIIQQLNTAAER